ncbi:MAG: aromatic ring-hydroxylating dioxygenase subunit alpha [Gammaproteobacteria bacterium]|nr:aromatic ring-hydroxylating dioxygenase subunit alpha [Gammaproteobacteria bacterium]
MTSVSAKARRWMTDVGEAVIAQASSGTLALAPEVIRRATSVYTDPGLFDRERIRLFRRLPLMLAASCEIRNPGDYRTFDIADVPIVLIRNSAGEARAMVNICTHRGSPLVAGQGSTKRFSCPYHGWTFGLDGQLIAVASPADFGVIDREDHALVQLPLLEKGGMIWVIPDPDSQLDIEGFLGTFGDALCGFELEDWTLVSERQLPGANWKLAFDAHLEFYHLPVLHRNTFGPTISNQALYFYEGPHERLIRPARYKKSGMPDDAELLSWQGRSGAEWPLETLMQGEWILFPNVSFNSFYDGGRGLFVSRVYPGSKVGESITVQSYFLQDSPDNVNRAKACERADFLEQVVAGEDLSNSFNQQRAMDSGLLREVMYGRNEGGIPRFHGWVDRVLATPDDGLNFLFQQERWTV